MATSLTASQIPELVPGRHSPVKVVQDAFEEQTENKVSLLKDEVASFSIRTTHRSPTVSTVAQPTTSQLLAMRYVVNDKRNAPNAGHYKLWITPTSPGFSWGKNIRVELNGQVTQSSLVSDMQLVQNILSVMESSIGIANHSPSNAKKRSPF